MLKILHTSDVHLGAKLSFLGEKARDHRRQIADTFRAVAKLALARQVDIFFVAGDLFDSGFPAQSYVYLVQEVFAELTSAGIHIAVIPGNHDRLEEGSILASQSFAEIEKSGKLKIFRSLEPEIWQISALDTTIYGIGIREQKSKRSPLAGWARTETGKYHVGLAHGSVDIRGEAENYPIAIADINKLGLDYLALGDWHSCLSVSKKHQCWYSGAPELINSDQGGAGNCLYVEVDTDGTRVTSLPVGTRSVSRVSLELKKYPDNAALKKEIQAAANPQAFLHLELQGLRAVTQDLDIDALQAELEDDFFYLRIKDNSRLELSAEALSAFPEEMILGKYIRLLEAKKNGKPEEDQLIDEAIQYGVSLLQGHTHED